MTSTKATKVVNKAAHGGDHDRVAMLSLNADGSPDQHDPEIIGDKEFAVKATARQFREQAVSAADVALAAAGVATGKAPASTVQDPTVAEIQAAHDAAAGPAEEQARKVVESLHNGDADAPDAEGDASK